MQEVEVQHAEQPDQPRPLQEQLVEGYWPQELEVQEQQVEEQEGQKQEVEGATNNKFIVS